MARVADVNVEEAERYIQSCIRGAAKNLGRAVAESSGLRAPALDISGRAGDVDRNRSFGID